MYETKGVSISADLWGIDFHLLNNLPYLRQLSKFGIARANATFVKMMDKKFYPTGVTVMIMLEESSYDLHTYPEQGFASVNIYTCGEKANPQDAIDYIIQELNPDPKRIYINRLIRGVE